VKDISRRDFLKVLGAGAVGLAAGPALSEPLLKQGRRLFRQGFASDVVQCFDENATAGGSTINEAVVQVMMDESIKRLTNLSDVGEAWKSLFPGIAESSVIGIKIPASNPRLPAHREFVNCIVSGLARMKINGGSFIRNNVIIWDRTDSETRAAGFTIYDGSDPDTPRCFGTDHPGVGYDDQTPLDVNGVVSYPSRILSGMSSYLINATALKTHATSSVTLALKNHFGSINNAYALPHSSGCNPAIPALEQQIRDVVTPANIERISIIDGLFGLYSGGPLGAPNFNPKLIIMSRDVVAIDVQGQNIINAERQRHSLSPLNAVHITTAAEPPYSLGSTDVNLIELNTTTGIQEPAQGRPFDGFLDVAPQPVRSRADVTISLARASDVSLDLADATGRSVARIHQGPLAAGRRRFELIPDRRIPNGRYLLRLRAGSVSATREIVIAR
jgi:hypothetical protein